MGRGRQDGQVGVVFYEQQRGLFRNVRDTHGQESRRKVKVNEKVRMIFRRLLKAWREV